MIDGPISPYDLPPGPVQICFSGGRTSAFLLHEILSANGGLPADAEVIFTNTGAEHPATLDFVAEVSDRWSVPVTWLEYAVGANSGAPTFRKVDRATASEDGQPFEDAVGKKQYLPNQAARFCTIELKVRTAKRYLMQARGWTRWTSALGIRADEPKRLTKTAADAAGRIFATHSKDRGLAWYPLAQAGIARRDIDRFWRGQPFRLRLPSYKGKTPAGNCVGCFLKGEATLATLWRDMPERMAWWRDMEARAAARWDALPPEKRAGLIEKRIAADLASLRGAFPGGDIPGTVLDEIRTLAARPPTFSKRYTQAAMADMVARQGDWIFDLPGHLCQANDGECTG